MDALESYLVELSANRLAGAVPETSGYGPLANLLNDVGQHLKPKVRCVINPANRGAGIPDGGLFIATQFEKGRVEPLPEQLPARGALEVKPVGADLRAVAESEQVRRYLKKYRQVLVTNYREFVLVGYGAEDKPALLEDYSLASSETGFWPLTAAPHRTAELYGERLTDFLRRVLLRQAQIVAPKDLAWFLASYAREARARAEERDLPNWVNTRKALEEALGMSFSGEKGEHFFRSTLVQTLFYGLFAAWVFWAEHHPPNESEERFRWREAAGYLHIPVLQKLFYDFSQPGPLGVMRIDEVLDWAGEALDRVDRASFFSSFEQSHAVQYFYEPFLEAFDPELRKELGVWYTPPEIVQYMVARVETVLREELDIPDGLADPRVVVLDPCCGTGAYLVEVLNKIAATLAEKSGGVDALAAHEIKQTAMNRVFGFEILPAPFVISHLQIGMLLHRLGAPLSEDTEERAGVYLTNALTGWEPPAVPKQHLLFTEMEEERDKAEAVKHHAPILVVLGNPPYNGFAGVSPEEEGGLVDAYKRGLGEDWGITKNYLDDLYIRFFRIAERRIGESASGGVVSFISNFSWLGDPSAVLMRQRILEEFDTVRIDCLNGDSRETGKRTPNGLPDPSVFSTRTSKMGIQVGTAISTLVKVEAGSADGAAAIYRDFWGADKLEQLGGATEATEPTSYASLNPSSRNRFALRPMTVSDEYYSWPSLAELSATEWSLGLNENRGGTLVDADRDELVSRMKTYLDPSVAFESLPATVAGLTRSWARFKPAETRCELLRESPFSEGHVRRFLAKPFDLQWAYVETTGKLWNESRSALVSQASDDSAYVLARCRAPRAFDGAPLTYGHALADQHALHKDAYLIPLRLSPSSWPAHGQGDLLQTEIAGVDDAGRRPNLSPRAIAYVESLEGDCPLPELGDSVWLHVLAVGYAAAYLEENADGVRQDWPRVPLPATFDALRSSAEFGRRVSVLLDVEESVEAVTCGSLRRELRPLGVLTSVSGRQLDPSAGDLGITAGWGHAGQGGVTMPGRGRAVERPYTESELAAFREGLADLTLTFDRLLGCLGDTCYDVSLSESAYWRCVPARAWQYTVGGYQAMKKWLSYRERTLLGRDLKPDEARYFTEMTRRISAILLLEPQLDANYEKVKANAQAWSG